MSYFVTTSSLGRNDKASSYELEKRGAIYASKLTVADLEDAGLTLIDTPPPSPSAGSGNRRLARYMLVPSVTSRSIDPTKHCEDIINKIGGLQTKAIFVCFQAAVKGTRQEYRVGRTSVNADEDIMNHAMMNMSFADSNVSDDSE